MKNLLITASLATALTLSSTASFAGNKHHSFRDSARVTHVETLYKTVRVSTPQRECWEERPHYRSNNNQHQSYTSTIVGGIVGGLLGNQFGGGSGKKVMTVAGAVLGGSVGRDMGYQSRSNQNNYRGGEQCRVVDRYHEEERADGYNVTYRYQGKSYTTYMDTYPGKRIPVEVSVRPISRHYY
ncbi:MAG: hypothetical protein COB23_05850 [Methylophaga sp.]|nr:MAG: hypothetical protein COB23_05850 [Methylophaga sp.]